MIKKFAGNFVLYRMNSLHRLQRVLFCSVSWVRIQGTLCKAGAIVFIESHLLPEFAEITDIVLYDVDHCLFVCKPFITNCFVPHFHSFEVRNTDEPSAIFVKQSDLADYHTVGLYSSPSHPGCKLISLKYHVIESV